ncbi:MAG: hypothetical protein E7559_10065 [Ruminococcaceae bacterium]|nr:hypothetical protein [Oscillospiraceae bacterium]
MSYCVNCGVELTAGTKQCPLCYTVVINPNGPDETIAKPPYPIEQEELNLNLRENTRMTALLISVVLALPAVICMVCDYGLSRNLDWSNYVIASCALAWCFVVPPVTWKRTSSLSLVIFDTIAVAIFLYIIYRMVEPANDWFTPLALPLTLCSGVLIGIATSVFRTKQIKPLVKLAIALFSIAGFMLAVEVIVDLFLTGGVSLYWSLIAMAPCGIFALLMLIIERKQKLKDFISKHTFV